MAFVNFATREITAKIVYYGPGLGGKTTSLQNIHNSLTPENRGKMISLATEEDRTIYFDFLPLNLGKIQDFAVRVQLYTVPGQVRYNATRKLVLRGADGLVFVADSQSHKKLANIESFNNMEENLREHGKDLRELPHALQFNKIDLPSVMTSEELNQLLNKYNVPFFETCATSGIGVLDALKSITKLVFNDLSKKALLQKKAKTSTQPVSTQYNVESSFTAAASKPTVAAPPPRATEPPRPVTPPPTSLSSETTRVNSFPSQTISTGHRDPVMQRMEDTFSRSEKVFDDLAVDPIEHDFIEDELQPEPDFKAGDLENEDNIQEVEPIEEFDESLNEEITIEPENPPASLTSEVSELDHVEPEFEPLIESKPEPASDEMTPTTPQSSIYSGLFNGTGDFLSTMETLEKEIAAQNPAAAVASAKKSYEYLMSRMYPADLVDGNETLRIFALGMKFNRFLRFKKLLESAGPSNSELQFVHHFLTDLYLSIKEF